MTYMFNIDLTKQLCGEECLMWLIDWLIFIQLALRMNFIYTIILQQDKKLILKSVETWFANQ